MALRELVSSVFLLQGHMLVRGCSMYAQAFFSLSRTKVFTLWRNTNSNHIIQKAQLELVDLSSTSSQIIGGLRQ